MVVVNDHLWCLFTGSAGRVGGLEFGGSPWIDQYVFTLLIRRVPQLSHALGAITERSCGGGLPELRQRRSQG